MGRDFVVALALLVFFAAKRSHNVRNGKITVAEQALSLSHSDTSFPLSLQLFKGVRGG